MCGTRELGLKRPGALIVTQLGGKAKVGAGSGLPRPESSGAPVIQIIHELGCLDEIAAGWDLLASKSGSPMQSYAWARACGATFVADRTLQLVVVGRMPTPTAIAPLVRQRGALGCLEFVGASGLNEPMDFLYADLSSLAALADALLELGSPVSLHRIPADSPAVAALRSSYRRRGVVICRPMSGCPWISLHPGWAKPEQQLNSGRRSDLRRARRFAERIGPISCEVLSPTPGDLEPLLEEAFRVEEAGWKGREGSALAKDPVRGAFFRRYAAAACKEGILRLCFLRIGNRAVAMQFAVECGNRFWLFKIGYDEEFSHCSPGMLLILETVRYAAERGLRSYEFLGKAEPWIQMWTHAVRPCVSLRLYPAGTQGMAALAADVAKSAWRRLSR